MGNNAPLLPGVADSAHATNGPLTLSDDATSDDSYSFLIGTALSVYQNAGAPNTNWSAFEEQRGLFGQPTIEGGDRCGRSNNFWELYDADIQRAAGLNATCFRLSLEWGRLEPRRGQVDAAAVARYHEIFESLIGHGLQPVVTLYHFVHPLWFDELGGFEKEENIAHYVSFVAMAFREFGRYARLWITFNEPAVQTFCGYLYAHFPPARLARFQQAGYHLLHMMRAHTEAYRAIKALPGGAAARVGFVHNYMDYEPKHPDGPAAAYLRPLCAGMNAVWGTELTLRYFRTGKFRWRTPLGAVQFQEPGRPGLDFIGMNYYGRVCIDWKFSATCRDGEVMTDMPFPLYPPGLYKGISRLSELGVPIYITETGIADKSGTKKQEFLKSYFGEVQRAVKDGYDVRGLMYWTLIDNFEWAHGFHIKFGLFRWDGGVERKEQDIVPAIRQLFKEFPERMRKLHAQAQPVVPQGRPELELASLV